MKHVAKKEYTRNLAVVIIIIIKQLLFCFYCWHCATISGFQGIKIFITNCEKVVPKSYQREGQPRKTENELTNDEDGSKPNPNPNPKKN